MAVTAVMGTTEESAIDDLHEILNIRDRMRGEVSVMMMIVIMMADCDEGWWRLIEMVDCDDSGGR